MASTQDWLQELRRSHDSLSHRLRGASDSDLAKISGSSEWTVADVASHLGSQAEIFEGFLDAGLGGADPPSQDTFPAIWEKWNGRSPRAQAEESVSANEALVDRLEGLDRKRLDDFELAMFGMTLDAERFMSMRLSEHALHSWDIAVAFDPTATIAAGSVDLLVDVIEATAARTGKPSTPSLLGIVTAGPERRFVLDTGGVTLAAVAPDQALPDRSIQLPAEALIRVVYGRVSDAHPPQGPVTGNSVELSELTATFPGF